MCARTESIVLARSTMLLCKRVQRVLAGRELVPELRDPRRHGLRPPSPRAGWRPPRFAVLSLRRWDFALDPDLPLASEGLGKSRRGLT
jgi:hypothetical protein